MSITDCLFNSKLFTLLSHKLLFYYYSSSPACRIIKEVREKSFNGDPSLVATRSCYCYQAAISAKVVRQSEQERICDPGFLNGRKRGGGRKALLEQGGILLPHMGCYRK
ncbi:Casbene synthase, chloroplastic [Dirofilaria immitis]